MTVTRKKSGTKNQTAHPGGVKRKELDSAVVSMSDSLAAIKQAAKARGLDEKGTKAVLLQRLAQYEEKDDADPNPEIVGTSKVIENVPVGVEPRSAFEETMLKGFSNLQSLFTTLEARVSNIHNAKEDASVGGLLEELTEKGAMDKAIAQLEDHTLPNVEELLKVGDPLKVARRVMEGDDMKSVFERYGLAESAAGICSSLQMGMNSSASNLLMNRTTMLRIARQFSLDKDVDNWAELVDAVEVFAQQRAQLPPSAGTHPTHPKTVSALPASQGVASSSLSAYPGTVSTAYAHQRGASAQFPHVAQRGGILNYGSTLPPGFPPGYQADYQAPAAPGSGATMAEWYSGPDASRSQGYFDTLQPQGYNRGGGAPPSTVYQQAPQPFSQVRAFSSTGTPHTGKAVWGSTNRDGSAMAPPGRNFTSHESFNSSAAVTVNSKTLSRIVVPTDLMVQGSHYSAIMFFVATGLNQFPRPLKTGDRFTGMDLPLVHKACAMLKSRSANHQLRNIRFGVTTQLVLCTFRGLISRQHLSDFRPLELSCVGDNNDLSLPSAGAKLKARTDAELGKLPLPTTLEMFQQWAENMVAWFGFMYGQPVADWWTQYLKTLMLCSTQNPSICYRLTVTDLVVWWNEALILTENALNNCVSMIISKLREAVSVMGVMDGISSVLKAVDAVVITSTTGDIIDPWPFLDPRHPDGIWQQQHLSATATAEQLAKERNVAAMELLSKEKLATKDQR